MVVPSVTTDMATAGDLMAQLIARGVTQTELVRMWQEMLEEVECLHSLTESFSMHFVLCLEEQSGGRRGGVNMRATLCPLTPFLCADCVAVHGVECSEDRHDVSLCLQSGY